MKEKFKFTDEQCSMIIAGQIGKRVLRGTILKGSGCGSASQIYNWVLTDTLKNFGNDIETLKKIFSGFLRHSILDLEIPLLRKFLMQESWHEKDFYIEFSQIKDSEKYKEVLKKDKRFLSAVSPFLRLSEEEYLEHPELFKYFPKLIRKNPTLKKSLSVKLQRALTEEKKKRSLDDPAFLRRRTVLKGYSDKEIYEGARGFDWIKIITKYPGRLLERMSIFQSYPEFFNKLISLIYFPGPILPTTLWLIQQEPFKSLLATPEFVEGKDDLFTKQPFPASYNFPLKAGLMAFSLKVIYPKTFSALKNRDDVNEVIRKDFLEKMKSLLAISIENGTEKIFEEHGKTLQIDSFDLSDNSIKKIASLAIGVEESALEKAGRETFAILDSIVKCLEREGKI